VRSLLLSLAAVAAVSVIMLALGSPLREPGHCGCGARDCSMPCTICCAPDPCPCSIPPSDPGRRL